MVYLKLGLKFLLGMFFIVAGINHFINPAFYINIMPDYLPWHRELVLVSGATEIIAGILLLIPRFSHLGAWAIIAMLVAFMPVHIHMVIHADRFADVPVPLLYLRIVLQGFLILWAAWYTKPSAVLDKAAAAPLP